MSLYAVSLFSSKESLIPQIICDEPIKAISMGVVSLHSLLYTQVPCPMQFSLVKEKDFCLSTGINRSNNPAITTRQEKRERLFMNFLI